MYATADCMADSTVACHVAVTFVPTNCIKNTENGCPAHGMEFIYEELVAIPRAILEKMDQEFSQEKRRHQRYLERQRANSIALRASIPRSRFREYPGN